MLKVRAYELRLPADWPPASVTVNGVAVKQAGPLGKEGWSFQGNTLTTVIPVPGESVAGAVTVLVHRAEGLSARRGELDGFAGVMTRLRGAYDALNQTPPVASPPDILIDAMQSGDRLGYHPERAQDEIAHFRDVLPKAQAAVKELGQGFQARMDSMAQRMSQSANRPADLDAQKQHRLDAMTRAGRLVSEAGN